MKELEKRIRDEGFVVGTTIVKVDSFINHQIDTSLLNDVCAYLTEDFHDVDKVLTIETSGIAFAIGAAQHLGNIPVVFAKKSKSLIVDLSNVYTTEIKSFTRNAVYTATVDKRFLSKGERILVVDDFLANGNASLGLIDICRQAGAEVIGVAVAIEKSFQGGRQKLESQGYKVVSGANIVSIQDGKITFAD